MSVLVKIKSAYCLTCALKENNIILKNKLPLRYFLSYFLNFPKSKDTESSDKDKENQGNGNKKKSTKKGNTFFYTHILLNSQSLAVNIIGRLEYSRGR